MPKKPTGGYGAPMTGKIAKPKGGKKGGRKK